MLSDVTHESTLPPGRVTSTGESGTRCSQTSSNPRVYTPGEGCSVSYSQICAADGEHRTSQFVPRSPHASSWTPTASSLHAWATSAASAAQPNPVPGDIPLRPSALHAWPSRARSSLHQRCLPDIL